MPPAFPTHDSDTPCLVASSASIFEMDAAMASALTPHLNAIDIGMMTVPHKPHNSHGSMLPENLATLPPCIDILTINCNTLASSPSLLSLEFCTLPTTTAMVAILENMEKHENLHTSLTQLLTTFTQVLTTRPDCTFMEIMTWSLSFFPSGPLPVYVPSSTRETAKVTASIKQKIDRRVGASLVESEFD